MPVRSKYWTLALLTGTLAPVLVQAEPESAIGSVIEDSAQLRDEVEPEDSVELSSVVVTAAEELKQAPGVSVITADDIRKRPPVNDLSDIIRKMPGVNLSGNSSSGQYGNKRQIDLRGMGPENTLILIDGKPVRSRNSVRMGRGGERNTRGDTNWVPAELVERIEVIRGPAAARYGSGAMGGVVNIITKKPTDELHGSISHYMSRPESKYEGQTDRYSFNLMGGLTDTLSFRLYGNVNKTDADDAAINSSTASGGQSAGKEGVRNRDVSGMLRWDLTPNQRLEFDGSFSRQGNIYEGDLGVSTGTSSVINRYANSWLGRETNIMYRTAGSVTHEGDWSWGTSKFVYQYENTRNHRLNEGLAGGLEGSLTSSAEFSTSEFDNYAFSGEFNIPTKAWGMSQMTTYGFEYTKEVLDDPFSVTQSQTMGGTISGVDSSQSESTNENVGVFVESNIYVTDRWTVTPGLRYDNHTQAGINFSPSLNTSYDFTDTIQVKAGIARAIKAPNLYQSNTNYIYYSNGNGCPDTDSGCYVQGNDDLDAERSWNFELGVAFNDAGWSAGVTYFRNVYKDKIQAGLTSIGSTSGGTSNDGAAADILQWENASKAVVAGWEGNLTIPILGFEGEILSLSNNFTYMIENKNKGTGEQLSVIPKFTVNSILDWQATKKLNLSLSATLYGYQDPRKFSANGETLTGTSTKQQGGYALWAISSNYDLNDNWSFGAGINNLFDKEIERKGNTVGSNVSEGGGASTYNEPGRAFYANMKYSF